MGAARAANQHSAGVQWRVDREASISRGSCERASRLSFGNTRLLVPGEEGRGADWKPRHVTSKT